MANYNVDNIEVSLETTVGQGLGAVQILIDKITELTGSIKGTTSEINKMGETFDKKVGKDIKNSMETADKATKSFDDSVKGAFKTAGIVYFTKKVFDLGKAVGAEALQFSANQNLLNATMGKSIDLAEDFQNAMSNSLFTSRSETMGFQGYFQGLTTSLGIANEGAMKMSENLTKLTYDLGSLYNLDPSAMYSKLQSGLIGQTKPLRSLGIDVTSQTMQKYLDNMGLDVMVHELDQAEKTMLRYIGILDQSQIAHGNLAMMIEQPANQIRMLKAQIKELGVWMGNVFIGTISRILPYINAFVMAIKEITKAIAMLFGYKGADNIFKDVERGVSGVGGIGASADKSAGSVKKLKQEMRGLFGWDEIHNVQTPTEPSTGGSGSGGTGALGSGSYYDDLLASLGEYDNLMTSVNSKAEAMRDKLLDWLGFSYDINALTGELSNLTWVWDDMSTNAKILVGLIGTLAGFKIVKGLAGIYDTAKLLGGAFKLSVAGLFGLAGAGATWTVMAGLLMSSMPPLIPLVSAITIGLIAANEAFKFFKWGIQDSIPEVDKFKGLSEETTKVLKPFINRMEEVDDKIRKMTWAKSIVTQADVNQIEEHLNYITDHIQGHLINQLEEDKQKIIDGELFKGLDPATIDLAGLMQKGMDETNKRLDKGKQRMLEIVQNAANENRALTENENKELASIQKTFMDDGIRVLTKNEEEQDTIYRNIRDNTSSLSAQQALRIIESSAQTRDALIADAEQTYADEMRIIDDMWERGEITDDQYRELKELAEQNKRDSLRTAEEGHANIMTEAEKHAGELWGLIDTENFKILTNFEAYFKKFADAWKLGFEQISKNIQTWYDNGPSKLFSSKGWKEMGENAVRGLRNALISGIKAIVLPSLPSLIIPDVRMPDLSKIGTGRVSGTLPRVSMFGYADGGFPDEGEMYIAREAGDEMVGKIGSKSVVANNEQVSDTIMRSIIESGVLDRQGSSGGNQQIVLHNYIGTRRIGTEIIDAIDEEYITTGKRPKAFG